MNSRILGFQLMTATQKLPWWQRATTMTKAKKLGRKEHHRLTGLFSAGSGGVSEPLFSGSSEMDATIIVTSSRDWEGAVAPATLWGSNHALALCFFKIATSYSLGWLVCHFIFCFYPHLQCILLHVYLLAHVWEYWLDTWPPKDLLAKLSMHWNFW